MFATYTSPLVSRYSSHEMAEIFSPLSYARCWRRVWLALAEAQAEVGAPITEEQLAAMRETQEQIDLARVAEIEAETRHDVMAHLLAWGEVCPIAKPIIHLGATSQFVNDNAEALIFRQGMTILRNRLVNVIRGLSSFAHQERARPTLGYSHFQPAQLVTVGKRTCLWIQDLVFDLNDLAARIEEYPCRGAKGTVGTQASYLDLLGSPKKVIQLDQKIAEKLGFARSAVITGQSLSRKHDTRILDALAGISTSLSKLGRDMRLLMHTGELREPFRQGQVGSSAMPYKRNPMLSERLCALSRVVLHQRNCIADMAGSQWLERSLDDSATRRISIPEAFLACDGALRVAHELSLGLHADQQSIDDRMKTHLPFLAVEKILAEVVKSGGDRQEAHEKLRVHAMACFEDRNKDFHEELFKDPLFKPLKKRLKKMVDPQTLIGMADIQVSNFLDEVTRPLLRRYSDVPALTDALSV
ncbi:MAG: adenylosuccinate lyase [Planctomycetota bacterium]|nr:adenylosuccinate lyase [Planctomycetota bacterium]